MKSKKVKRRYVPDHKGQALSLLNQAKRAFLRNEPVSTHVANYLLEVIYSVTIDGEKNAQRAFGLAEKAGAPNKTLRNTLFAARVNKLRATMTREQAFEAARHEFPGINSEGAADSAYRIGQEELVYMREVDEFMGQTGSDGILEKLREEYESGKKRK